MSYKQTVAPNLATTGRLGWCLEYAAKMFGFPKIGRGYTYAWDNWVASKTKHTNQNFPTDVAVPCWFSYIEDGINKGHVVVRVPGKGFYSSPWKYTQDHAVLQSIIDIQRIYRCTFVGWTEDVAGITVVTPVVAPAPVAPAVVPKAAPAKVAYYIVRPGDTLSAIAARFRTTWQRLYAKPDNRKTVGNNPNLIQPGEKIDVQ